MQPMLDGHNVYIFHNREKRASLQERRAAAQEKREAVLSEFDDVRVQLPFVTRPQVIRNMDGAKMFLRTCNPILRAHVVRELKNCPWYLDSQIPDAHKSE
jgi:hypothetical protein